MKLRIATLAGTTFELRVSSSDTILMVKSKIQRLEGVPVSQQHLIWQDSELSDHQTLRYYNISAGSTLRLVLGMRGGPINIYRPPSIAPSATIRFTPSVYFASSHSAQKNTDSSSSADNLPTNSAPLNDEKIDVDLKKHVKFYFVNVGDRFELIRSVNNRYRKNASTTSLLGSEYSSEYPINTSKAPPISSNLLSASAATQSLPFLQSEESKLSYKTQDSQHLAATNSEPSVLKASDRKQSSSPKTIAASTSLFAGYVCGRDTYTSDTDDCLSSDFSVVGNGGAAYFLRPPSPEWDNRDLSTTPPITVPPSTDCPFFPEENEEKSIPEEDHDSLADLKDCLVYYQSCDLHFGPRKNIPSSSSSNFAKEAYTESSDSPIVTRAKFEEWETLAKKMRHIKAMLSQQKQERIKRKLKQQNTTTDECKMNVEARKS